MLSAVCLASQGHPPGARSLSTSDHSAVKTSAGSVGFIFFWGILGFFRFGLDRPLFDAHEPLSPLFVVIRSNQASHGLIGAYDPGRCSRLSDERGLSGQEKGEDDDHKISDDHAFDHGKPCPQASIHPSEKRFLEEEAEAVAG